VSVRRSSRDVGDGALVPPKPRSGEGGNVKTNQASSTYDSGFSSPDVEKSTNAREKNSTTTTAAACQADAARVTASQNANTASSTDDRNAAKYTFDVT
jgi:hypothetical protein